MSNDKHQLRCTIIFAWGHCQNVYIQLVKKQCMHEGQRKSDDESSRQFDCHCCELNTYNFIFF